MARRLPRIEPVGSQPKMLPSLSIETQRAEEHESSGLVETLHAQDQVSTELFAPRGALKEATIDDASVMYREVSQLDGADIGRQLAVFTHG